MQQHIKAGALALLAVTVAACDTGPIEPEPAAIPTTSPIEWTPQSLVTPDPSFPDGNLHPETVTVCKDIAGAPGVGFDFTVTSTRNDLGLFVPALSLGGGECMAVAQAGGAVFTVTVAEAAPPAGFRLDSIVRYNATFVSGQQPWQFATLTKQLITDGSTSASGEASGGTPLRGALIIFYNSAEPPPPPPEGGEGCTPGYWKQTHHFGNWSAPYTPTTLFADVFDDAFPGKTLLDVLGEGGGGLKALGRHTVAALLNSASGGVAYNVTTGNVISSFNAAFASGEYEAQKNLFEGFNEQGCPLGRAE